MPPQERDAILAGIDAKTADKLLTNWRFLGRREQFEPEGVWSNWLINAGRGWGKTRTGAETVRARIEAGISSRVALIAPTNHDAREVMIEGPSGLMSIATASFKPHYNPSRRMMSWPNGAECHVYSAEEPERLRGPAHDFGWCDELAAWKYLEETWDNYQFGLRMGKNPRTVITTTPKPRKLVRQIMADAMTVVTGGSTFDNSSNLPDATLRRFRQRYEGTRLGRQELYAELLDEAQGALFKRDWFEANRVPQDKHPPLVRRAVAIDPAATGTESSDETGIVCGGIDANGRGYLIADDSGRYMPQEWSRKAILQYFKQEASFIIAERNNGGDMVATTIRMTAREMHRRGEIPISEIPIQVVWASKGKAARAEPVSSLYEQGRVSHVGAFSALEDQCCTWEPNGNMKSPDRLDAMVWLWTELIVARNHVNLVLPESFTQVSHWHQQ